ncbi:hypothetical protein [Acinetobacter sp.]|uniref:hypothetical protein n=1 Tax=Acinetobacter sp. TaxID=472 RepID=UPI0035B01225
MKTLLISIFILCVSALGFIVHKDTEMKKQAAVDQLLNESVQPKRKLEQAEEPPMSAANASDPL